MAQLQMEDYTRLIAQKAWATWRKLPPSSRAWIDIEDLIQDGALFARFVVRPKFRPHRSKFSTFLSICLEQYYSRKLASIFTEKRNKCQTIPIDNVSYSLGCCDSIEQEIYAVETIKKISSVASPILRRYLNMWLTPRSNRGRGNGGRRFQIARSEMRRLSDEYRFTREDFEFLLHDQTWCKTVQLPNR